MEGTVWELWYKRVVDSTGWKVWARVGLEYGKNRGWGEIDFVR